MTNRVINPRFVVPGEFTFRPSDQVLKVVGLSEAEIAKFRKAEQEAIMEKASYYNDLITAAVDGPEFCHDCE